MRIIPTVTTACLLVLGVSPHSSQADDDTRPPARGATTKSTVVAVGSSKFDIGSSADQELRSLFVQYKDALSTSMVEEADTLAKKIVDVSIRSNGLDSKVTAVALTNLGILQRSNEDAVSAVQNFAAAIEIVERVDNRLSPDLIVPLREMGSAQLKAGFPDRARAAWNRAVHVSHVNFGPHNMEQVEPLHELARMYFSAGMNKEAVKVRRRIYYLQSRDAESWKRDRSPSL